MVRYSLRGEIAHLHFIIYSYFFAFSLSHNCCPFKSITQLQLGAMFWSQQKDERISRISEGASDSLQKQASRKPLPPSLQQLVDRDDDFYDELYSS